MEQDRKTWTVSAHIEYDLEATCEEHAIELLAHNVLEDLKDDGDIQAIADVHVEKISDGPMPDEEGVALQDEAEEETPLKHLNKSHGEHSVTREIIQDVHGTLADAEKGREILKFLAEAEPIFFNEVNRFIQAESSMMPEALTDEQVVHVSSVIGAAYLCGYLIARNAAHRTYDDLLAIGSPVEKIMAQAKHLVSKEKINGLSVSEIMGNLFAEFMKESIKSKNTKEGA